MQKQRQKRLRAKANARPKAVLKESGLEAESSANFDASYK